MKLTLLSLALAATLSVTAVPTYECSRERIEQLAVFGDSYSDIHNVYELSKHTWPLPNFYYRGRFSDGPMWPEYLTRAMGYRLLNHAFGGATSDSKVVQGYTGPGSTLAVPGFIQQIQNYNPHTKSRSTIAKTLFAVDFQGNDFIFDSVITPQTVLANLERGIRELIAAGAKHFLIVENFDYGLAPFFSADPAEAAKFSDIAVKEQAGYKDLIHRLRSEFGGSSNCHDGKGVNFAVLDMYGLFKRLTSPRELRRLRITEVEKGCVSNDYKTMCPNPEQHFYVDDFHPTTKIHYEIAKAALEVL
ncbi:hypothetical protein CPB97_010001 [Podila verticillata]|nr:hypothetical protein CPB97_010001 [Podila verticillata]